MAATARGHIVLPTQFRRSLQTALSSLYCPRPPGLILGGTSRMLGVTVTASCMSQCQAYNASVGTFTCGLGTGTGVERGLGVWLPLPGPVCYDRDVCVDGGGCPANTVCYDMGFCKPAACLCQAPNGVDASTCSAPVLFSMLTSEQQIKFYLTNGGMMALWLLLAAAVFTFALWMWKRPKKVRPPRSWVVATFRQKLLWDHPAFWLGVSQPSPFSGPVRISCALFCAWTKFWCGWGAWATSHFRHVPYADHHGQLYLDYLFVSVFGHLYTLAFVSLCRMGRIVPAVLMAWIPYFLCWIGFGPFPYGDAYPVLWQVTVVDCLVVVYVVAIPLQSAVTFWVLRDRRVPDVFPFNQPSPLCAAVRSDGRAAVGEHGGPRRSSRRVAPAPTAGLAAAAPQAVAAVAERETAPHTVKDNFVALRDDAEKDLESGTGWRKEAKKDSTQTIRRRRRGGDGDGAGVGDGGGAGVAVRADQSRSPERAREGRGIPGATPDASHSGDVSGDSVAAAAANGSGGRVGNGSGELVVSGSGELVAVVVEQTADPAKDPGTAVGPTASLLDGAPTADIDAEAPAHHRARAATADQPARDFTRAVIPPLARGEPVRMLGLRTTSGPRRLGTPVALRRRDCACTLNIYGDVLQYSPRCPVPGHVGAGQARAQWSEVPADAMRNVPFACLDVIAADRRHRLAAHEAKLEKRARRATRVRTTTLTGGGVKGAVSASAVVLPRAVSAAAPAKAALAVPATARAATAAPATMRSASAPDQVTAASAAATRTARVPASSSESDDDDVPPTRSMMRAATARRHAAPALRASADVVGAVAVPGADGRVAPAVAKAAQAATEAAPAAKAAQSSAKAASGAAAGKQKARAAPVTAPPAPKAAPAARAAATTVSSAPKAPEPKAAGSAAAKVNGRAPTAPASGAQAPGPPASAAPAASRPAQSAPASGTLQQRRQQADELR